MELMLLAVKSSEKETLKCLLVQFEWAPSTSMILTQKRPRFKLAVAFLLHLKDFSEENLHGRERRKSDFLKMEMQIFDCLYF